MASKGLSTSTFKIFEGKVENNLVYFTTFSCHLFVFTKFKGNIYLSDGGNTLLEDDEARMKLRDQLHHEFIYLLNDAQTCYNFCASSAIVIAYELAKAIATNQMKDNLVVNKRLRDHIISLLHKNRDVPINVGRSKPPTKVECPYCGKRYLKAVVAKNHISHCKNKALILP